MANSIVQSILGRVKRLTSSALHDFSYLLWPAVCGCCGTTISKSTNVLCRDCWDGLMQCTGGDYCDRCGRDASRYGMIDTGCASCQGVSISIDGIARGGVYDKPLRDMILAFKFNDRTELSGQLCFLLNSALQGSDFKNDIDMFVPVPLHWRRRLGRGFNQSLILCKGLDHRRRISTELVRIRHTQRQWNLDLGKRIKNVADAFAVRKGHDFSGKNICLVDDISTTRSTLEECAKTLKEAGAEKVFALVCAVAMQDTAR